MSQKQNPDGTPMMAKPPAFGWESSETLILPKAQAVVKARHHLQLPNSPTERDLEPARLAYLADRLLGGTWMPCQWATVLFNGVEYRVNGRHSSTTMIEYEEVLPDQIVIHQDAYKAANAEQMGVLFRQFDNKGSVRSSKDVSGAYQGLVPALQGLNKARCKLAIEGACWQEKSIEKLPRPSKDDRYELLLSPSYHKYILWMDKIISVKTPEMLYDGVIGAMFVIFNTSESGAQEFWSHVAKDDLNDDGDARQVLSKELTSLHVNRKEVGRTPDVEYYAKCIKAWNAFRAGDKIRTLSVNTKKGLPEIAA
jgi:hypothetical protein